MTPEWGEKKAPKYINSPETPIFLKGQLLFNLHLANKEISEESDFILVEGQLDAIRCHLEGFKTTVAPQGTAFKETQAELMRKSNPRRVVCLLDGDEAGQKAALSYIPIFLEQGCKVCNPTKRIRSGSSSVNSRQRSPLGNYSERPIHRRLCLQQYPKHKSHPTGKK